MEAARALAHAFHANGVSLVYGGGTTGLMGEIAKTLVELSGPDAAHGIIPKPLLTVEKKTSDPVAYGRTTMVDDMHSRKKLMAQEVDAGGPGSGFIALTGGWGTIEEVMEMTAWNQLGIHSKGAVLFNVEGFWNGIMEWVKTAVDVGFIKSGNAEILKVANDANEAVMQLKEYRLSEHRLQLDWKKS